MKTPVDLIYSYTPINYEYACNKMAEIVDMIIAGKKNSTIWLLEHPPIYTAGRGSKEQDLLEKKFPVYHTGRGGKYTYHGPGQRIVYLMLDLRKLFPSSPDIRIFIRTLEEVIIKALAALGLKAFILENEVGVWVKSGGKPVKIAALGIRVKKWVTSHGIAINLYPNLEHYSGIIPCGLSEYSVSSLKALGYEISLEKWDEVMLNCLYNDFALTI